MNSNTKQINTGDRIVVFASDLNLRPGVWPETISSEGITYKRGRAVYDPWIGQELASVIYSTPIGSILEVVND